jgi:hypothetical protein
VSRAAEEDRTPARAAKAGWSSKMPVSRAAQKWRRIHTRQSSSWKWSLHSLGSRFGECHAAKWAEDRSWGVSNSWPRLANGHTGRVFRSSVQTGPPPIFSKIQFAKRWPWGSPWSRMNGSSCGSAKAYDRAFRGLEIARRRAPSRRTSS